MILHEKNETSVERLRLVEDLVENAAVDTVYGDLYLQRARDLLVPVLSEAEFAALQLLKTEARNLPNSIMVAMKQANWMEVKDLSTRMASVKRTLAEKESLRQLGEKIYKPGEPPMDPFSPGLQGLAGSGDLQVLQHQLSAKLERLQTADPDWRGFYAARRSAIVAIKAYSAQVPEETELNSSQLEQKAFEALKSGDFAKLEELASLIEKGEPGATERAPSSSSHFAGKSSDLTFQFSQEVVTRAGGLGLSPMRMEADLRTLLNFAPEDLTPLYRYLWHPTFTDEIIPQGAGLPKKEIPLPTETPAALRDLMELYALHPFINSGGARYVPFPTEEDVLFENFDEPVHGKAFPASALLSALGLEARRGLSRIRLEKALHERGNTIIRDIGLDPFMFRLICIPPDVYGRVGHRKGWGRQQLWTHFDGYMVMQNKTLSALAGGDVRFGGLFDLVGISREYESDRIVARFAVVQRKRMEAVNDLY